MFPFSGGGGITPSSSSSASNSSNLFTDTSKTVQFGNKTSSAAGIVGAACGVAACGVAALVLVAFFKK